MFNFWRQQPPSNTHPLHPHHTGRVESDAVSVRTSSQHQECSNCRAWLSGKPSFHCKICEYLLCTDCTTIYEHPVHVQHQLYRVCDTRALPDGHWRCNVCCKQDVDSVGRYQCNICDFNVCQQCFAPKTHPLHTHQLMRTDVRHVYTNNNSLGQWFCDSCRNNNGPGNYMPWHCNCCQFDLCDNCAKSWYSTAHPKHVFLKSDSKLIYADYNGGWGCDHCGTTFSPEINNKPFHCQQCDYDLCDNCMKTTGTNSNSDGFDVPLSNHSTSTRRDSDSRSGAFTVTQSGKPIASPESEPAMEVVLGSVEPAGAGIDECVICSTRPKNATLVHGDTGHVCCCHECAMRLKSEELPCPICRAHIDSVIRQYTA